MKKVLVIDADDEELFFLAVTAGALTIGANPAQADAALEGVKIRRIRCEVEVAEDVVVVAAPAARGPDGRPPRQRQLRAGEQLQIGPARLRLEPSTDSDTDSDTAARPILDEALPEQGPPPTPTPSSPAGKTVPAAPPRNRKQLLVIDGADERETFCLPYAGSASIGNSGKHADICLHDFYVSRVHCLIETVDDNVFVTHSEGKNGTLVNGQRIAGRQELHLGDVVRVGNSHLRLELADAGPGTATVPSASEPTAKASAARPTGNPAAGGSAGLGAAESRPLPRLGEAAQSDPKAAGGQVVGRYQLGPPLGAGHTGQVYRAHDVKTGQVVALKVLAPDFPSSAAELQQFGQALKAATPLQHPNLVSLYGAGKSGPHCWIAREHVEGESVDQLVRRLKDAGKPGWVRAVRVALDLAEALAFLHEHKTVHGNITPRNVLVSSDKVTKLAGLMLARALADSRLQRATAKKKLLSELPYRAPEQVEPGAFVDHLADLYAVGAVVYFLATGEPPFSGGSVEEITANIRANPPPRPSRHQRNVPFAFEGVLLKLLAKHQEERYQTASDLLVDVYVLAHEHQIQV